MRRLLFVLLLAFAGTLYAQEKPALPPTPEEIAFARLPADIQQMLAGMTAAEAMQTVAQAHQQAIALGLPNPTPVQFRTTLGALLNSQDYTSASAGATSFPPLSPLVPPPPPPFLR
ncbi:MAG: hypothetical protein EPO20_26160 [Betaproteobacteria bacterium]|nr:MAG: hypothetical protein EPO20_26160 [Betaproteobacteria bacterium]